MKRRATKAEVKSVVDHINRKMRDQEVAIYLTFGSDIVNGKISYHLVENKEGKVTIVGIGSLEHVRGCAFGYRVGKLGY